MAQVDVDRLMSAMQGVFSDKDGVTKVLEMLADLAMREEVCQHLKAQPHQRSEDRQGHRNGYKPRTLQTRVGTLELSVPQVRGCEPYHPSLFGKWERSERALWATCAEIYFQGVSTRNVRAVLEVMCDGEISATTVSRVAAELDQKLAEFRNRRLDHTNWPYLQIDARYEKVRVEGKVLSQAVLVTVGFDSSGRREVLDYRVADSESQGSWGELFGGLKERGLSGVKLVVSDAHGGIRSALSRHFQGVAWQRCQVHLKREMTGKVSYKKAGEVMADLRWVFGGGSKSECLLRGEEMACKWEKCCVGVSKMIREGLEDCLTVLSFPAEHRRKLSSTNLLENLMRRLKKRTKVVGIFPNRASCERLIGSQLLEVHEKWQSEEKRYFNMELAG